MIRRSFDTNILIYYLDGVPEAVAAIKAADACLISKIVEMEVMVGCKYRKTVPQKPNKANPGQTIPDDSHPAYAAQLLQTEISTRAWIKATFTVLPIDDATADFSVVVRKHTKADLPDTVIHATAMMHGIPIVTRNVSDFPALKTPAPYLNVSVMNPIPLALKAGKGSGVKAAKGSGLPSGLPLGAQQVIIIKGGPVK
jgi:predicted nucleic acid-binding protein